MLPFSVNVLLAALGATLVIACGLLAWRKRRCELIMGPHISRPPEWPLLGVGPQFIGLDNEAVLELIDELLGRVATPVRVWFGPMLIIAIAHPDDMQIVLSSQDCLQKGYMYKFMHNETGIFTSDPPIWRQHRRLLVPTFSLKNLQRHEPVFNAKSRRMCDIIEEHLQQHERSAAGAGKKMVLDVYHAIFMCTLDSTVNSVMSAGPWELQNAEGERFHDAFAAAFGSVAARMYRAWQIPDSIYRWTQAYRDEMVHFDYGNQFIYGIIERKQRQLAEIQRTEGRDVLAEEKASGLMTYVHKCLLLHREGVFDKQNLRDEVETILIGGIDTTSVTVTHTLLMLAIHADVQDRLVREMELVFGRERWWNRNEELHIGQEDVVNMVYLRQVMHESLRLFPAGPFLARMCNADLKLRNTTIPAGTAVLLLITRLHRDPATWGPTADDFDPDRFAPEQCAQRHPWAFLPFSGGPRNCVGQKHAALSTRTMIAHLLRRFRLGSRLRLADVRIKMDITSKVVNEEAVWVERRELPADLRWMEKSGGVGSAAS